MTRPLSLISLRWLFLFACLWLIGPGPAVAQAPRITSHTLAWDPVVVSEPEPGQQLVLLSFQGSFTTGFWGTLPQWHTRIPSPSTGLEVESASVSEAVYIPLTVSEQRAFTDPAELPAEIHLRITRMESRESTVADITLLPFRRNGTTGNIEKLLSFDLTVTFRQKEHPETVKAGAGIAHSILSTGKWYKIAVSADGVYKLSYEDLTGFGIDLSGVDPHNIRIYGNGGGMLPESNSAVRTEDLKENAILVMGEEDGVFGPGDHILFYGESPDRWTLNSTSLLFTHRKNIYSDQTCYFLNFDIGPGRRLLTDPGTTAPPTNYISRFNDHAFFEEDTYNMIKTGREWYDANKFDVTLSRTYPFEFPNIDASTPVVVTAVVAARSVGASSSFTLSANSEPLLNITVGPVSNNFLDTYAIQKSGSGSYTATSSSLNIKLDYTRYVSSAAGYLNYLEVNAMRDLVMSGTQMHFRSVLSHGPGKTAEFRLTTQGQTLYVWDVSEPGEATIIPTTSSAGLLSFRVATDELREFIAFDGTAYLSPQYIGPVGNQDLHGMDPVDYVIITHPDFMEQAQDLAGFHRTENGFSVAVVETGQVYNEYSSGSQDITAIRDFMKMLYDKSGGQKPDNLLLFGDASYDYKDRVENNRNLVPTYESQVSLNPVSSIATDDYFVMLDPSEGQLVGGELLGTLDMGIGRFPVQTTEEAESAIRKIRHYTSNSDSVKNNWRNIVCFVADDEDGNLHMRDVETITNMIGKNYPVYNIDKIYLDAYQQISTPGGQRCPEMNEAISKRVQNGSLIISYAGHGGEVGWGHERFLEVADINSWNNLDNMPVFVTATCEFSRYDDPERISAGEYVFLNPNGGGISLFTTARPTYSSANLALTTSFYNVAFEKEDGHYLRMGDLIRLAKNDMPTSDEVRKFVLLGDPGLMIAYPKLSVVTTGISSDTLQALSLMEIQGEVQDESGNLLSGFSGEVFPTVFDKSTQVQTLGDNGNSSITFEVQKNQVYSGKALVENGTFSFSFIVPKDISYDFGPGKISYYARSEETDANGFDTTIVIGGFDPVAAIDTDGPDIQLYMNDRLFVDGSMTDPNPVLLADVSDFSGINTVGNGIGHDITAVLDSNTKTPIILNDYYVADLNTYKSGVITYPLSGLSEGPHLLTLKVWDVYNNSSEASIRFVVIGEDQYLVNHLYTYPNPFKTSTTISFETNRTNSDLDVELTIYNLFGRMVKKMTKNLYINGFRCEPMTWDGTDDSGSKCAAGLYICRLVATLPDGTRQEAQAKMILQR